MRVLCHGTPALEQKSHIRSPLEPKLAAQGSAPASGSSDFLAELWTHPKPFPVPRAPKLAGAGGKPAARAVGTLRAPVLPSRTGEPGRNGGGKKTTYLLRSELPRHTDANFWGAPPRRQEHSGPGRGYSSPSHHGSLGLCGEPLPAWGPVGRGF